ncbi:MAG: DNA-binding NtrC family response regulator [Candidatus Marinamargulisbacteria bacterium]|jgi:DNA-binding NtrC family response regulator
MSKPLILLAYPDAAECRKISRFLEHRYEVTCADTAKDAIRKFKDLDFRIRIVLLSTEFEDIKSFKILETFQKTCSLPEIIMISPDKDIQQVVVAMKKGAYDFALRPIDPQKLLDTVDKAIESIDYAKKMQNFSKESFFKQLDLDIDLVLLKEAFSNKAIEGKVVSAEDILSLFPTPVDVHNSKSDVSFDKADINHSIETKLAHLERATILVVEDEDIYRKMIAGFLKTQYEVITADSLTAAIRLIQKTERIDVILLDIFLPDGNGIDMVPTLKEMNKDGEIVIVSAFELLDKAIEALREGACDYITKPVLKEDIFKAVSKALRKKYVQRVIPEFEKKFIEQKLSERSKIEFLNDLSKKRQENGHPLYMEDIYIFFPELRKTYIHEGLSLPNHILDEGVLKFIQKLKTNIDSSQD